MQLCGALVLFMTLTTACGLRCYTCLASKAKSCTDTKTCAFLFNRCFTMTMTDYKIVTRGCQNSVACGGAIECCKGDLCNSAALTGSSVMLVLVSSAIIALFL